MTTEKSHKLEKVKPESEKRKVSRAKKEESLKQVPVSRGQKSRAKTEKSHGSLDVTPASTTKQTEHCRS